jgi:hypothetical protein
MNEWETGVREGFPAIEKSLYHSVRIRGINEGKHTAIEHIDTIVGNQRRDVMQVAEGDQNRKRRAKANCQHAGDRERQAARTPMPAASSLPIASAPVSLISSPPCAYQIMITRNASALTGSKLHLELERQKFFSSLVTSSPNRTGGAALIPIPHTSNNKKLLFKFL